MKNKKFMRRAIMIPMLGAAIMNSTGINIFSEGYKIDKYILTNTEVNIKEEQADYVFFELDRMRRVGINIDNILLPSNITLDEVEYLLQGTELFECSQDYLDAEEKYGVNALALISITALESSWGTSRLAKLKNNLSGFMAYNVETFESAYKFDDKRDSIMSTAEHLKNNYLSQDGKYYNGTGLVDINYYYCTQDDGKTPDYSWSSTLIDVTKSLKSKLEEYHNEVSEKLIMTL